MKLAHILLLAAIALAVTACGDKADKAAGELPEVVVLKVSPQTVPMSVELPARVSAFHKAEVRPQVGGILQRQLFTEGSLVKEGQSLYKIDPDTYEAEYQAAKAALASAQAKLAATQMRRERRRALLGSRAVSRQDYEDADADFLQAQADVKVCEASLRTAEIRLRHTDVLAPIAGRIGKSTVTQGALVTAHQQDALAVIQQLDRVYVDMNESSVAMQRLRERYQAGTLTLPKDEHTTVTLTLESGTKYPLEGKLQFADITVEESTGMVLLRAVFPNPERILLPGMYVRARVSKGTEGDAILVPQRAVRRNAKGQASLFLLREDNSVVEQPVQATERVGANWLIRAGLAPGDSVVTEGMQRLRHGMKVRVAQTETVPAK